MDGHCGSWTSAMMEVYFCPSWSEGSLSWATLKSFQSQIGEACVLGIDPIMGTTALEGAVACSCFVYLPEIKIIYKNSSCPLALIALSLSITQYHINKDVMLLLWKVISVS